MDPKLKREKRKVRARRVRAKIKANKVALHRLSVYKTNTRLIAQVIDDSKAHTLAYATSSDKDIAGSTPMEKARALGEKIAKLAKEQGVEKVVFDRSGFTYTGKIKAVADAAREAGLKF